jgi:uncharacterized protein (UPF0548 family)
MSCLCIRFTRPSVLELERLLAEARHSAPTYAEVGGTRTDRLPSGYRHDRYDIRLGRGNEVFGRAADALRHRQAQRGSGIEIVPAGAWVEENETVLLLIRARWLRRAVHVRIRTGHTQRPERSPSQSIEKSQAMSSLA